MHIVSNFDHTVDPIKIQRFFVFNEPDCCKHVNDEKFDGIVNIHIFLI